MEFEKWSSLIAQQDSSNYLQSPRKLSALDFASLGKIDAEKCAWVRSQIPEGDTEFITPFGTRRLITHAEHTTSGQPLLLVENVITGSVLPVYGNTHTTDSLVGLSTTRAMHVADEFVKRSLGGTHDEALFYCGSEVTGAVKKLQECIGVAAPYVLKPRLLKMMRADERWVVFVGPFGHHSHLLSWRASLAEVVEIPINEDGSGVDMRKLEAAVKNPAFSARQKLGCFSAACNVTGIITDTRAIARLMHKHGAFVCFDFAASGPHLEIDMRPAEPEGCDALVVSPHKFMGGPGCPTILLMSKDLYLLNNTPPSTCGGGTVDFVNGYSAKDTVYIKDVEEREDAGTPPILQRIRAGLAFWVREHVGVEFIQRRERYFITSAIRRLQGNPRIRILGNTKVKRCPILSFLVYSKELAVAGDTSDHYQLVVPPRDFEWLVQKSEGKSGVEVRVGKPLHSRFIVKLLSDLFGIQAKCEFAGLCGHSPVGIDLHCSLSLREAVLQGYHSVKPGFTRISFNYHISDDEFQFILSAIEFVAEHGQNFLPCYDFDWNTGDWTCKPTMNDLVIPQPRGLPINLRVMPVYENYNYYLEAAEVFAAFLPEFPPERLGRPQQIDSFLIDFRV